MNYTVSRKRRYSGETFTCTVRAATIEVAAQHAATRFGGRNARAVRTTGSSGFSGYFQAYKPVKGQNAEYAVGEAFHVS